MEQSLHHPRWSCQELDEIIKESGGLFVLPSTALIQNTIKSFNSYINIAETYLYTTRSQKITYAILYNSELNAFAYTTPKGVTPPFDFIGINSGAILTLTDTFMHILSHPDNFPDVGNKELEDPSRAIIPNLTTNSIHSKNPPAMPNCPIRAGFASMLAQVAIDFIFFHELTRLRNGHIEFVRERLQASYWSEAMARGQRGKELVIRQTLEWDADCGAVQLTTTSAFLINKGIEKAIASNEINTDEKKILAVAYGNAQKTIQTVLYATYVFFRIFNQSDWSTFRQLFQTHPEPLFRMTEIGPMLFEIFSKQPDLGDYLGDFQEVFMPTITKVETDLGNILGKPPDYAAIRNMLNILNAKEYHDRLRNTWQKIRPYLEEYKRGENLAD